MLDIIPLRPSPACL